LKGFGLHSTALFLVLVATGSFGQISPGDLSRAHAEYEGMSNCTLCHDLGKKVSNSKCLDCHKEIRAGISQKKGYHANPTVTKKDCFECHSEHHGRKFEMIRFDEAKFEHDLTSYPLEGKHTTIDCRSCHKPENIQDSKLKKRSNTFLGLNQECITCHNDYHQNTLSKTCMECHDMNTFRPASKFDHNKAAFKLRGKHKEVDCIECHQKSVKSGKEFQAFTGVQFAECTSCHQDPHNNRIPGKCTQCHTENSFTEFRGKGNFDHAKTGFQLKGKHAAVDCFACHKNNHEAASIFQRTPPVMESQCASCHKDVHEGKFGANCAQCHTETGFTTLKSGIKTSFNHDVTDFPLNGMHVGVDCKACHKENYSKPIDFSLCKNCHADYHQGEFRKNGASPDCAECHSVMKGFEHTTYTVERHQKTRFALQGAHSATPCFACHVSEEKWKFKNIGTSCAQCHNDVHEARFAINGITDCTRCHDSENWFPRKFDHNLTAFPLEGRHAEIECKECHKSKEINGKLVVIYKIEKFQCIDCHQ
jgi:hypothetical protein